ncbi:imelysin family protein [Falsihalocynthiibacter arcticus]|uniref:Peptidase M75 n=1 Tax=Falsihalocynthiibacter arcticus TaxID=1579316 RepID=A0A126V264_9RHOB|nr:imelysin family protein [Falsihalocynthiibacter arcticus]AML52267.1 peptidase M75 [Falsihalocynthiibacter arcticus]
MRKFIFLLALVCPLTATAADPSQTVRTALSEHILPRFEQLVTTTQALETTSQTQCNAESEDLQAAFHTAFDAWIGVSHLRFGPTEVGDRAFALAFWPDTKGFTPKTLASLIQNEDPAVQDPEEFAHVSIAGRGFFALEFLLYDADLREMGTDTYRCELVQAITTNIHDNATAILTDWQETYSDTMLNPSETSVYRNEDEAVQELFKAFNAGLQFTSDTRLGRPLGTFDRPLPARAEARRSERSRRHIEVSLTALQELAAILAEGNPSLQQKFTEAFETSQARLTKVNDPRFASVTNVQDRFLLELVQQSIDHIREISATELGPKLGVAAGFNSLDGD